MDIYSFAIVTNYFQISIVLTSLLVYRLFELLELNSWF
jgi:hypothetical protein